MALKISFDIKMIYTLEVNFCRILNLETWMWNKVCSFFHNMVPCSAKITLEPVKDLDKIFYKIMNMKNMKLETERDSSEISEIRHHGIQDITVPHLKSSEILTILKFLR